MKNRFGFIPIVLPAIVMVLIIGLINLTGVSQTPVVEAQTAPRLMDMTLKYDVDADAADGAQVELKRSGGTGFSPTRTSYTAGVDNDTDALVVTVTLSSADHAIRFGNGADKAAARTAATDDTVDVAADGTRTADTAITSFPGDSTWFVAIVYMDDDPAGDPNAGYDEDDPQTEYTLEVSKNDFAFDVATDPHLTETGLVVTAFTNIETADPSGSPAGDVLTNAVRRHSENGLAGFNPGIKSYYLTVDHEDQWIHVEATADTDATDDGHADAAASITPDDAGDASATPASATTTVMLDSGKSKKIEITVSTQGGRVTYSLTIKRSEPVLGSLGVTDVAASPSSILVAPFGPAFTPANLGKSTLETKVAYQYARATVALPTPTTDAAANVGTSTAKITLPKKDAIADDAVDADNAPIVGREDFQVNLKPGDNKVTIVLDQWVQTPGTTTGKHTKRTYTLNIERTPPRFATAAFDSAVTYPSTLETAVTDAITAGTHVAANLGTGDPPTFKYPAGMVEFDVDEVTLDYTLNTNDQAAESKPLRVTLSPSRDQDSQASGHQVKLAPGKNEIKMTVTSGENSQSKRVVVFTINRAETELEHLVYCDVDDDGDEQDCSDDRDRLVRGDINTTTPGDFDPDTTTYTATTSYANERGSVGLEEPAGTPLTNSGSKKYRFTSPISTTTDNPLVRKLRVGNNTFSANIGAGAKNNTTTYTLTVDRLEPQPVIQFELYDVNGDEIIPPDDTQLPLELVSATRRYTMGLDDGFSVNVRSVRMNAYLGDGVEGEDVKVSVGRVSIPMAASLGDFLNYHTMDLAEGSNTIAFEVEFRQHPDDQSLSGRSVHTLTISREGNSQPTFRPNHSLGQALIEMVDGEEVVTSTTALPHAVNGNGELTYTLVGKGGKDLPEGLEVVKPEDRTTDGWIEGIPNIQPRGAYADHTLILKVVDGDDVKGANDEDMVEFTIRIFRDEEARRAAQPTPAVGPGQLINLGVYYDDPAQPDMPATCKGLLMRRSGETPASDRKDCGMLMPKFDPATMSYMVDVPTDVETVDIHAVATSSATLTLRGPGSPELGAGSGIVTVGDNKRHEWNGYRVLNGSPAQTDNIYIVKVTEGSDTNEYRLTIRRETDTPVKFDAADKADIDLRFYEDIPPVNKTGSGEVKLPAAMPGSGNGATSTWVYALERTDKGTAAEEIEKLNFEGLSLETSTRKLVGTPTLQSDEGRPSDRNGAPGEYSVTDADLNTAASDGDTIAVDITVYRDVTLSSYSVGDVSVSDLGEMSRKISSDWSAGDVNDDYSDWVYTWDASDDSGAMLVDAYTFPVSHTATEATFSATKSHSDATMTIKPDDADASASGHQVTLGRGDNVVTITVTNGDVSATHKINLVRPGLQASDITVTKDRGRMTGEDEDVDLMPEFDRDTYSYTAMVENWIETLRISATAVDQAATVSVNLDAINTAVGFAEVRLDEPEGSEDSVTTFRIGITNPTISDAPGLYILAVTRKGNTAPTFDMTQGDKTVKNNEAMTLKLPEAMGGNGKIMHKLTEAELPNGLMYSESTRTISGTPVLTVDQGFESDFILTYTAVDQDSDTSDSDSAMQTFTLTVTNGDVPVEPVDEGFGPDENFNTLRSLVVTFQRTGDPELVATLVPAFNPSNGGPYTAIVPHDAENVWVTPSLSDAGAALWIDNIAQQDARKVKIESTTEIMVEHTTHPALGSMTYTVELSPTNQSVPSFAGKSIDDMVVLAGEDMGTVTLPAADGGNTDLQPLTYTLKDHGGREIPRRGIGGIHFDGATRTLSGTPVLNADADKTIYRLSYQATDQDGDMSEVVTFMVTVCRDATLPGCSPTEPEPNPGSMPMGLEVSISGNTATLTWQPGDDAMRQFVGAVDPTATDIFSTIRPAPFGDDQVAADAKRYVIEDLPGGGANYVFVVAGYDGSMWHVAIDRQ